MNHNLSKRRLVEYVLYIVLMLLVLVAVWVSLTSRNLNRNSDNASVVGTVEPGTTEEINQITDQNTDQEEEIFNKSIAKDKEFSATIDSSADDLGGAYDETSY